MSNWFRMTPDSSLDRCYLRTCAVYRCLIYYGVSDDWAIDKLSEIMTRFKALQVVSCWKQTHAYRNRKIKIDLFNWRN